MNIHARLSQLERLARLRVVGQDLAALGRFAFYPGEKPPDLPDEHPARPFVELLKRMHGSVAPLGGPEGSKDRKALAKKGV